MLPSDQAEWKKLLKKVCLYKIQYRLPNDNQEKFNFVKTSFLRRILPFQRGLEAACSLRVREVPESNPG